MAQSTTYLRRRNKRSVTRMHARILYMFTDGHTNHASVNSHTVDVNFLRIEYELADNNWMLLGNDRRLSQIRVKIVMRMCHVHGGARQHVRRSHQARIANRGRWWKTGWGLVNPHSHSPKIS